MRNSTERRFIGWDRDEASNYFIAGGGQKEDFDRVYELLIRDGEQMIEAIDSGTYHTAGGALTYLIAAEKGRQ